MRKGFLGSLAVLAAGAGLTFGQPTNPPPMSAGSPMVPPPDDGSKPPAYMTQDGKPYFPPAGFEGMMPPGGNPDTRASET